jgi:hypothetical protein
MSKDLNDLLRDWPFEPGQLQARKIVGNDGKAKLQLRLDMGILQMEMTGRPDGHRPNDAESLLSYHQDRAKEAEASGQAFSLTPEEVGDLQTEGIQYYHRYVALYQLEDWKSVMRDTRRNLEMFSFVVKHSPNEEVAWSVDQFRPYVIMMNTRARAYLALGKDDFDSAVGHVERGIDKIERFLRDHQHPDLAEENAEVIVLKEWLKELRQKLPSKPVTPPSPLDQMRKEMEKAVRAEQYERAAELRDAIKAMESKH